MKHYAIAELTIEDPAWIKPYVTNVTSMVERHGGRYLARTPRIETVEGEDERPHVVLLIEWPSKEAAYAFYDSEEYAPYRESRQQGAVNRFLLVAGEDVEGVAQIPQSSEDRLGAERDPQTSRDLLEHDVPVGVTERVVDFLEPVEIDQ